MTEKKTPLAAFLGTSLSSVFVALATFISGVLIARTLGPEARAEYGTVLLLGQTIATLGCLSFYDGAIVQMRVSDMDLKDAMPTMALSGVLIITVSSALAIIAVSFLKLDLIEITQFQAASITALLIVSSLMTQYFSAAERSKMNFFFVNFSRVITPTIFSFLIFGTWFVIDVELSVMLALALFLLSKIPALMFWGIKYAHYSIGPIYRSFFLATARTGLNLHVAVVLGVIASQLDRIIAIGAWPKALLGQYFVAFSAVGAGYAIITTAVTTVLFPYMAGLKGDHRQQQLSLIIRMTVLISTISVIAGAVILPSAVPTLYGDQYIDARNMSLLLLLSSAILPLRTVILEANRSTGQGRPAMVMALVQIAIMALAFALTGFIEPWQLILALGLSNITSTLAGSYHLWCDDMLKCNRDLIPSFTDLKLLISLIKKKNKR